MKRKFKRDYIILEAKDLNYKFKDKVSPKAFAKIEMNDDKYVLSLYAENLKVVSEGYSIFIIDVNYDTKNLGEIFLSDLGKGEKIFDLSDCEEDIKAVCLVHKKCVPLVGFKGPKLNNYEELLFKDDVYEEVEYVEVDENDDYVYEEEYEYIEIEDDEYENYQEKLIEYDKEETKFESKEKSTKMTQRSYFDEYDNLDYVKALNKTPFNQKEDVNKSKEAINQKEEYDEKMAQTLLMPRQIKKGLKMFKEVRPFAGDYIEKSRWWKMDITPVTMCGYSMPNLGYINTLNYTMYSDAVMNSYKYRHYLFGVQYDGYNRRKYYIYGVPGKKNEQPDKGLTGFNKYQPCDVKNDSMGYWLCFVDCKTRKILK